MVDPGIPPYPRQWQDYEQIEPAVRPDFGDDAHRTWRRITLPTATTTSNKSTVPGTVLVVGDSWWVKDPSSLKLVKVHIKSVTVKTVEIEVAQLAIPHTGMILGGAFPASFLTSGRYERRDLNFIEKVEDVSGMESKPA